MDGGVSQQKEIKKSNLIYLEMIKKNKINAIIKM